MARPRSDIQPRIVEAARRRFLADGVDGASLREIAREAGTNIGMVVYYFPSKDDLFLAVVEDVYAAILRDLGEALGAAEGARERLRRALVRLGTASEREVEVIRLVAREVLLSSTRFERIASRFERGHIRLLVSAIADGVREGDFAADVPAPLLLLSIIGLCGLPQFIRRATTHLPVFASLPGAEGLADASLDLLFRAIGGPADAKTRRRRPPAKTARRPRA
jgi:AcrR family transcriptional regulator